MATEENALFLKTDEVMTPQEAKELGVTVETATLEITRPAPPREEGHQGTFKYVVHLIICDLSLP